MQPVYARTSLLLFGISLVFLIGLTVFESALLGMSQSTERILTFLILVLPAAIGAAAGVYSLTRKEGKTGLAIAGLILNTLFALFHLMIVLFAG